MTPLHEPRHSLLLALIPAILAGAAPLLSQDAASCTVRAEANETTIGGLLREHRYLELDARLHRRAGVAGTRDSVALAGVLAGHRNDFEVAVRLLEPLARQRWTGDPYLGAHVHVALAQVYENTFQYRKAVEAYDRGRPYTAALSQEERRSLDDSRRVFDLLRDVPPQTIAPFPGFTMRSRRNGVGLREVQVGAGTMTDWWIFDTGASISTITESVARRLGLTLSAGTATTTGIAGHDVPLRVATIPRLVVGRARLENVVVLVLPDSALFIPQVPFQIDAILGYPVIAALGEVTFHRDGRVGVRSVSGAPVREGSNLFMEEMTPLLVAEVEGRRELYHLDSGADQSMLTSRFCAAHRSAIGRQATQPYRAAGAGGTKVSPSFRLGTLGMRVAGETAMLREVPVLAVPTGTDLDYAFGNLGQDLMRDFESYSLDFTRMRFRLRR